jgi:hypothetical protein
MTTAANITIKKADNTTNIVYSLLAAAGGDKSPAVWRSTTATGTAGQQPFIQVQTKSNGDNNVRRADILFVFPSVYTDTSGNTQIRSKGVFQGSFALPLDASAQDMLEMGAQLPNLIADVMFKSTFQTGYAPT